MWNKNVWLIITLFSKPMLQRLQSERVQINTRAWVAQWVRELVYLTTHTSLSPIRHGFAPDFVNYKKGCTRLAAASDKVYQLLARGRWFFPGNPASSTTKTGRHDIAESGVKHNKSNQINLFWTLRFAWSQRILVCLILKNCLVNLVFWQWSIDYGGTWWRLVQKRIVHTKFDDLRFIWRWLSERVNEWVIVV